MKKLAFAFIAIALLQGCADMTKSDYEDAAEAIGAGLVLGVEIVTPDKITTTTQTETCSIDGFGNKTCTTTNQRN